MKYKRASKLFKYYNELYNKRNYDYSECFEFYSDVEDWNNSPFIDSSDELAEEWRLTLGNIRPRKVVTIKGKPYRIIKHFIHDKVAVSEAFGNCREMYFDAKTPITSIGVIED